MSIDTSQIYHYQDKHTKAATKMYWIGNLTMTSKNGFVGGSILTKMPIFFLKADCLAHDLYLQYSDKNTDMAEICKRLNIKS